MKSRALALVPALTARRIALGIPAKAFELNGSWATALSACSQVFIKKDGAISFGRIPTSMAADSSWREIKSAAKANLQINRRKEDGNVIHMVAMCATDIMASNVQFSAKIIDDNTIARIFRECRSSP